MFDDTIMSRSEVYWLSIISFMLAGLHTPKLLTARGQNFMLREAQKLTWLYAKNLFYAVYEYKYDKSVFIDNN